MNKIITITLNSAVDNVIEIENLRRGKVIRAKRTLRYASGKGINSSRTISCLRKKVTAFCFVGKTETHFFNDLKSTYFNIKIFPTEGVTRSNITVLDTSNNLLTHLQTQGYKLSIRQIDDFATIINQTITLNTVVVISGSLPNGVPNNMYYKLISKCNRRNCKVIFDSSKQPLKEGLKGKPYLVKPNIEELQELFGTKITSIKDIVKYGKIINAMGIEYVFVSLGKKGVIVTQRNDNGYWRGYIKEKINIHTGDEIGCGDAMIGGIAVGISENFELPKLINIAVASGSANLLTFGPGNCKYVDIVKFSKKVKTIYYK